MSNGGFDLNLPPCPIEWGPHLWKVLHGVAEQTGKQTDQQKIQIEMNTIPILVSTLTDILPCDSCKESFMVWQHSNTFTPGSYEDWNHYTRTWFHGYHSTVNNRLTKEDISFNTLSTIYTPTVVQPSLENISTIYQRSIDIRKLDPAPIMRWISNVQTVSTVFGN